jgi:CHAT domain-containing protein/tetratricopeptide (TPR) repeat protein
LAFAQEPKLEPGQSVRRAIAGGESHTYQITLQPGQFARFRLEQQTLDSSLLLTAPESGQIAAANLTDAGQTEALVLEAVQPGIYRLRVRGNGGVKMRGAYQLSVAVQAAATTQDHQHLIAQTLFLAALELTQSGPQNAPQAIEKLEQALALWRELGEPFYVATTLNRIGRVQMLQNQNEQALLSLEQARAIQQELKNQFGEAAVLNNLANAYFNLRQFPKAIELFEQTLALYRAVQDRRWEGLILHSLGNTQANLNQSDKALDYYAQALTILREVNDESAQGQALMNQGRMYINRGQSDQAIAVTEAAIQTFRDAKDQPGEALALNNLAIIHSRTGQSEKAIASLERALAIFRERKDRAQEATTVITLGTVYGGMGQTEKAIEAFEQGLAISRELKDKSREALSLINLGLAHQFLSQYEKALSYLEPALPLNRELKNRQQEGSNLSYLGAVYLGLSRYEKAIECHEQSLAIFRELKSYLFEGNALQSLGNVYQLLGREDKAVEYFDQTLVIFRATKYRVGEGNILTNLASSYARLGRFAEALRANEQALAIFRELKYRAGEGNTLLEMGVVQFYANQAEKALELYAQALVIFRAVGDQKGEGKALYRMGQAKRALGQPAEAATLFVESATMMKHIGSRSQELLALTSLAQTETARGNLRQTLQLAEECVRMTESLRADLVSAESRTAFLVTTQEAFQIYTELLMRYHQAEPTKGWNALALEISERQRARSLLDLLTESRTDLRQGVDAALVTRERRLAQQLNDTAQQLAQATKAEQITTLKQQISQLETELERAQADIRKTSSNYAALTHPQPLKLKEIQQLLDADTLLLEYALGTARSYMWAVTKDTLTSYELPKGEVLETSARKVYDLLIARSTVKRGETMAQRRQRIAEANTELPAAALSLSQMILAPVAAELGHKRLVIVADGALQYVPFAMLPEAVVGGRWSVVGLPPPLIVRHEIISLPSASALAIQRREIAGRTPAPKTLAVIADPVFDRTDARLAKVTTSSKEEAEARTRSFDDERSIVHLAEQSDDPATATTRKRVIPRLPFTQQEANRLLALAPKDSTFGAIGLQANRAAALNAALSQYRYLHFATHGILNSERPGLSSLLLSMVDEQGKPQDGFLRANDIYNLKLPADLVVLSACQTGLGKEIKGEGLVGLTRGFMYAGAARVVVSLWNVNDQATAELMTKFYQKMLKQNQRPAAALRAAQVEMWKQKQWNAPFYWAAFTLQGEWK